MDKEQKVEAALQEAISHIAKTIEIQKANQNSDEVLLQATKQLSDLIDIISARLLQEIKDKANTEELQTLLKALRVFRDQALRALEKWNEEGMAFLEHNFKGIGELTRYEVQQVRIKTEEKKIDLNLNGHELFELIVKNEEEKEQPKSRMMARKKRSLMEQLQARREEQKLEKMRRKVKQEMENMRSKLMYQQRDLKQKREEMRQKSRLSQQKIRDIKERMEMKLRELEEKQNRAEDMKAIIRTLSAKLEGK